ncbi:MAG: MBL fold metallo-hydrolase [Pseudomonadota bacterium]
MGFASLGSGSKGNGTLVAVGDRLFLVDCGFSVKQTERRLQALNVSPGDINAIFVSHEHADHIGGVASLSNKYQIPVLGSYGTLRRCDDALYREAFDGDVPFVHGGVRVNPVVVPHDARQPTQFVFDDGVENIGVLSDLGCVTPHVIAQFKGCTHLLMEANHDRTMLMQGGYPPRLKRRVAADYGHLSNEQAYALLMRLAHPGLHVLVGHVSEQNNSMSILQEVFADMHGRLACLEFATQEHGFDWIGVRPIVRQTRFAEVF